ncbi:MAG: SDR family oxidoreductase [Woeseiaceae bacterium]|nr:SDR family oxidoreductase [Woeseiaceae bacterium]
MNLNNKTVLITGANRGIGKATVDALLDAGVAKIYAGARRLSSLPDFGDDRVIPIEIDITDPETVTNAAAVASDVDLLINNAGTLAMGGVLDSSVESIQADMNTNYFGTLDVIRRFVPVLETKPDAAIVNVVTIAAFVNFPGLGGYSASKAALFSLSQGIRIELAPRGISVHTVNPGPIDTDMARDLDMEKTSAEETARNIVAGLENDEAEIFPDPASQQMFGVWQGNYRDLEAAVYEMHHAN